uniref:CRAL-TRIO domain-containing protein n=2 Tax=Stomoxys calcitrans TaxID=35570 RepID=A0A1I8Q2H8_STOCA
MSQIKLLKEELQKVAIEELGEVPSRIPEDLEVLKAWINQQSHLKARTEDQFLIQFLRGCKYSLEKAKDKLDIFYAMKTKCPEMFGITDVDNDAFRRFHKTGTYVPLPEPLFGNGPRIVFIRANYAAPDFTVAQIMSYVTAATELAMITDPYACIHGLCYIMDFSKVTLSHVMLITPAAIKKIVKFFENTIPVRIKALHIINASTASEHMHRVVLPYIPENLRQRIFISAKNSKELDDHIPKKYLPVEYGGENGSLEQLCCERNKIWDNYREFFRQNADYGTEEHLRLGKPKIDFGDDLGIAGSFRKLIVD